jgi:uncharacterized membrane protein YdjX (TVP38/TMEM64 family)
MIDANPTKPGANRLRLLIACVAGLAIVAALVLLPVHTWLESILLWTRGLGFAGYLVVILLYVAACVLFIPGSLVTLATGFLFGVVAGSITVSIGSTLGASAAFLVGRYLAREKIEQKLAQNTKFAAIDQAVGQNGFKIVLLTRLSPVFPFNLLNYAFGLTRVRFATYALASWIGMMPGTILYVYLGSTAGDLAQIFSGGVQAGQGQQVFKVIGLIATLVVTLLVTRIARNALRNAIPQAEGESHAA